MIDDELYEFATDELNSDRRIPELWNRACALARDDHDEARFLYKNLRVEELLELQANGEPLPVIPDRSSPRVTGSTLETSANSELEVEAPLGLYNEVTLDENAFDARTSNDDEQEEPIASSNRAFTNERAAENLSEELVFELEEHNAGDTMIADETSKSKISSNETHLDAPAESLLENSPLLETTDSIKENTDTSDDSTDHPSLNPLVFPKQLEDYPNEDLVARPASVPGTEVALDLEAASAEFDLQSAKALNDQAPVSLEGDADLTLDSDDTDSIAEAQAELALNSDDDSIILNAHSDSYGNGNSVNAELAEFQDEHDKDEPLPALDPEISSLANQASERMRTKRGAFSAERSALRSHAQTMDEGLDGNLDNPRNHEVSASPDDSEMAFLDSSIDENRENIIDQQREVLHQKDALTEDLERQADTWLPDTAGARAMIAGGAAAIGGSRGLDENLASAPSLEQAELLSGPGKLYRVFSRGRNETRAVKKGLSWAAMFFTFPWLLVKRLPGTAIIYALLWVALLAGIVVTGVNWLDATPSDAKAAMIWPILFAVIAFIALLLVPLLMANKWLAASLDNRGFDEIATVRAKSSAKAIRRIARLGL